MDPRVALEIARNVDGIQFRYVTGHVHQTWAKTYSSLPELYIQPQSLPEIEKAVKATMSAVRQASIASR